MELPRVHELLRIIRPEMTLASNRSPVSYSDVFFGEWEMDKMQHFMEHTHLPISIAITTAYLLMVKFGPQMMANCKAPDLQHALVAWNLALCAYSGISFCLLLPYIMQSYYKGGIIGTLCYNDDFYTNPVSGYVAWLFAMSKGPELIDTVFLIVRKRPVIFMHWYHHSVTFLAGQIFFTEFVPWARYVIIENLFVHTIIYFALRAFGVKTPLWIPKAITCIQNGSLQITQFASAFYLAGHMFYFHLTEGLDNCNNKVDRMWMGCGVLATYIYLFAEYFHNAYIKKQSPTKRKATIDTSAEASDAKKLE
ncbi:hypothetical protein PRIPAC_80053 [Pristionchus pacificus]|uniref:Elongation of very long chain fatty acids protein n=1 Tax=Pristionchus pacificus TaxID=54126 RepID=A0A2A6CLM7_PRIPA|nr:hypothetical protein PRIPAC_80053 [Pristionchus pacificus]|eukprot:PDM79102.1 hypothetical protein PRIPAC_31681 [Pristionchus pacificus]